jgi:hypothetical protein
MVASSVVVTTNEFGVAGAAPVAALTAASTGNSILVWTTGAVDGNKFANDGNTLLIVQNTTAAAVPMTIVGVGTDNFNVVASVVVSPDLPGATTPYEWHVFGPFSTRHFNDADGNMTVLFGTGYANIQMSAFKLGVVKE